MRAAALLVIAGAVAAIPVAMNLRHRNPRPDLEVVASWWHPNALKYHVRVASGRIRNNSTGTFDTVEVVLDLYDDGGNKMYTSADTLFGVSPHGERTFSTGALPGQPVEFRVWSVRGVGMSSSSQEPSLARVLLKKR